MKRKIETVTKWRFAVYNFEVECNSVSDYPFELLSAAKEDTANVRLSSGLWKFAEKFLNP